MTLVLSASVAQALVVKTKPWLAGVTDSSVYVSVEVNNTTNATVDFGLTSAYGSQATTEYTQATTSSYSVHNIKLTGLLPNTQYHYRFSHGSYVSADYSFWTAPLAGTDSRWGFAADSRSGIPVHNAMIALIDSHDPRMMVYGGDIAASPTWSSWTNEWFTTNQTALNAKVPFVNAPGNHEQWNSLTAAFTQGPNGDGPTGQGYYSFDYGDTHILILNDQLGTNSFAEGSAQWNFAAADLAASTAKWKIVAFHRPAYVAGVTTWPNNGEYPNMINMTKKIFYPNGVSATLSGDFHFYQHNYVDEDLEDDQPGIHHMVMGSFGSPLYDPLYAEYTVYSEKTYNFGIFETTADMLTLRTYRENGTLIETIEIPAPAPPVTLGGDFDLDGDVDGVDFLYWQIGYPTASGATLSDGDADGDGDVDGADFGIWQAGYPTNLGGSTAVPEPATLFVMLVGGILLLRTRRK